MGRSAYESSFVKSKKPDPSDVIRFSLETTHFKTKPCKPFQRHVWMFERGRLFSERI